MRRARVWVAAIFALSMVAGAGGCGSAAETTSAAATGETGGAPVAEVPEIADDADRMLPPEQVIAVERASFPMTLENCGYSVTFTEPPNRVVAIKSPPVEMLLALGVGDRLVGVAGLDGPLPDWLTDAAAGSTAAAVVSNPMTTGVPGTEAVIALDPDLVFAGWESNLTPNGAGARELFSSLDVNTLVSPSACRSQWNTRTDGILSGGLSNALTFSDIWSEIAIVGTIFDVPDAAETLIENQQDTLTTIIKDDRGLTALWWSSAKDIPYVGAGLGAPQLIMDSVGLTNIAGDIEDTWTAMSWEQVIAADPDVIILVDAQWNTADSKRGYLETNPATSQLTAVRNSNYLTVPFPASEAGVRTVSAITDLAAQLTEIQ